MQPLQVKSKFIHAVYYSGKDKTLTIWYNAGGVYRYLNVSYYLYQRVLLNLDQPWLIIDEVIRKHPFKRITPRTKYPRKQKKEADAVDQHHHVQ